IKNRQQKRPVRDVMEQGGYRTGMAASTLDTVTTVIGRIPILDVQPAVDCGRYPAKSVAGETFRVSAVVFREGHGAVAAAAVLRDPDGNNLPLEMMHELAPGSDRWGTDVVATRPGNWSFRVEAWSDPIADWHHDAGIKVPRGQDIELVMAEGALLFDQASKSIIRATRIRLPAPGPGEPVIDKPLAPDVVRAALAEVARVLRDPNVTPWDRLAATREPEITRMLAAYPLRQLGTQVRRAAPVGGA